MDSGMNRDVNTPNLEQLMQLGIQTARQGNKENARVIFQQVLDSDTQNERAWLWMAAVAETPIDRVRYLNSVLRINPNNKTAQRELNRLRKGQESSTSQVLVYGGIGLALILLLIAVALLVLAVL
jgi:thioredoxin-like negative regulator of GroEL